MIRILIVDDHVMVREGLARVLEKEPDFHLAGQCASPEEAIAALRGEVTVVLLDVDLGRGRALEFIEAAKAAGFDGQILIVTAGISGAEAVQLVRAGVSGIMHKHHSTQVLCENIRKVVAGQSCIEPEYLSNLFRTVDRTKAPSKPKLTERDRILLRGIFQGLTNKDISTQVGISEGAVKASLRQLFDRLGVRTRAQAVKIALDHYREQL